MKSLDEKTLGEQDRGCEKWRFVMGVDEMAFPAEMGLYFDFNQTDGFPTGCPGFERFHGQSGGSSWSSIFITVFCLNYIILYPSEFLLYPPESYYYWFILNIIRTSSALNDLKT